MSKKLNKNQNTKYANKNTKYVIIDLCCFVARKNKNSQNVRKGLNLETQHSLSKRSLAFLDQTVQSSPHMSFAWVTTICISQFTVAWIVCNEFLPPLLSLPLPLQKFHINFKLLHSLMANSFCDHTAYWGMLCLLSLRHCVFPILSIGKLWNVIKLPISGFQHS